MFRVLVLILCVVGVIVCQGNGQAPCSAIAVPGPYSPSVSVYGDTSDAVTSAATCGSSSGSGILWYMINVDVGANVTVSTCSSYTDFDTYIRVYSGNCESLVCVSYDDDSSCSYAQSGLSTVNWLSTGEEYIIGVGGYSSYEGKFELLIEAEAGQPQGCANAELIPGPYNIPVTVFGSTVGADGYDTSYCLLSTSSHVKWYEITPTVGDQVTLSTCSSSTDFDTTLSVFTGDCDSLSCFSSSDDNCTTYSNDRASTLVFPAAQASYYVAVSGYSTYSGNFALTVSSNPPVFGCADAIPVRIGESVFGSTVGASSLTSAVPSCGITAYGPANWYYIPAGTQAVTVTTCSGSTNFDTILLIYQGACPGYTCIASADDSACEYYSTQSTVDFQLSSTDDTYIVVAGYGGTSGNYRLSITSN